MNPVNHQVRRRTFFGELVTKLWGATLRNAGNLDTGGMADRSSP
jgi:hypothetical protein